MSGKVSLNAFMIIAILFSMLTGFSCDKGDKKSILVVFNMSPGTVVYKGKKKVPVFSADPREDIVGHLKEAGFKVITKEGKPSDLKLTVEYHERAGANYVSIKDYNITLIDTSGQQLLFEEFDYGLRPFEVKQADAPAWFSKEIPHLILGRLKAQDELSFLVSRIQANDFVKILEQSVCKKLFKRIGGFQDSTAIDVILPFLRVGYHFTRWRVKYTLYTLGYRPRSIKEKAAWEIVDIAGPLGLHPKEEEAIPWGIRSSIRAGGTIFTRRLYQHHFIAYYGLDGINLLLEDLKVKRRRYNTIVPGGARGSLSMLSPKNWKKAWGPGRAHVQYFNFDKITYLSKQEVYRKLGSKIKLREGTIDGKHFSSLFQKEWNTHATENLIADLNDTLSSEAYLKDVITILGEIADKNVVESLKPFLADEILGEEAKKAIREIESR